MMKPVVPLWGFRFLEMIIPNSSDGAFRSLSILNDLDVREGNIDGGVEVSEKLVGGSTDDVGGLVLSLFLSEFSAWEDCESVWQDVSILTGFSSLLLRGGFFILGFVESWLMMAWLMFWLLASKSQEMFSELWLAVVRSPELEDSVSLGSKESLLTDPRGEEPLFLVVSES